MPPITKFWLCAFKDPDSVKSPEFQHLMTEILEFCSSYTNPEPDTPPMHAFYQDTADPARLFMITGYQSQELNDEAHEKYAENYLDKMFEFVQHKMLLKLDIDINTLPTGEHVTVAYGKEPARWREEDEAGGWDVSETREGADEDVNEGKKDEEDDRVWVQISRWNGADSVLESVQPFEGERLHLKRIAG